MTGIHNYSKLFCTIMGVNILRLASYPEQRMSASDEHEDELTLQHRVLVHIS
jgi:hypothetical protein